MSPTALLPQAALRKPTGCSDKDTELSSAARRKYAEWLAYACSARSATNEKFAEFPTLKVDGGFLDFAQVRVDPIDAAALAQYEQWESKFDFPWRDSPDTIKADSRHLDVSLWYGDRLCGLCFASPSGKRTVVRIKLLEGRPTLDDDPHPLKHRVTELCVFTVIQYCKIIGASEIKIDQPLEGAVKSYLANGFKVVNGELVLFLDA
jgi:hypothetical protein